MDGIGSRIARKQFFLFLKQLRKYGILRENERGVIEILQF